jgi:hypothetical protein
MKQLIESLPNEIKEVFLAFPDTDPEVVQMLLEESRSIVTRPLIPDFVSKFGIDEFKKRLGWFLDNPNIRHAERLADCLATMFYDD